MSASLLAEWELCLISAVTGMEMMVVYDILRVYRRLRRHSHFRVNLEDLLFWIVCGFWMFFVTFYSNNGVVRWYSLVSLVGGMCLWHWSVSPILVASLTGGCRFVGRILSVLWMQIRKIAKFCGKPLKCGWKWVKIIKSRILNRILHIKVSDRVNSNEQV